MEVFEVHGQRESLAFQGSLLRSVQGTSGLHPGYGSDVGLSPLAGRLLRYLDDWLVMASSLAEVCWARDRVLQLCQELGIVVNLDKSSLTPSQVIVYPGIKIESQTFRASPTPSRIEKFFSIVEEFLSSKVQSAKFWRVLLRHLASLMHLVPGGQLRMRALQLALKRGWNFVDDSFLVPWDAPSRDDLLWWCAEGHLEEGVSLAVPSPDHMFWSDASDQGWGATVADQFASGIWLEGEELFFHQLQGAVGGEEGSLPALGVSEGACGSGVFRQHHSGGLSSSSGGNSFSHSQLSGSAVSSMGGERGDLHLSTVCSGKEQCRSRCSFSSQPGGGDRVDSSSGGLQLFPQTLAGGNRSFCLLSKSPLWCVLCSGLRPHGCRDGRHAAVLGSFTGVCVSTVRDDTPGLAQTPEVVRSGSHSYSSFLAVEGVVPRPSGTSPGTSSPSAGEVGPPAANTRLPVSSTSIRASSSCVETIQRFARASGLSARVARRLGSSCRALSIANYQCKWSFYRCWCWEKGHLVSNPSVAKVADYLLRIWESKGLPLSSVKAHRSMLSAVFDFKLPELSEHHALRDRLRSFAVEKPRVPLVPPSWDLDIVFKHLMSPAYKPLGSLSLRALTKKTLFLVALATAKRVGELLSLARFLFVGTTCMFPIFHIL